MKENNEEEIKFFKFVLKLLKGFDLSTEEGCISAIEVVQQGSTENFDNLLSREDIKKVYGKGLFKTAAVFTEGSIESITKRLELLEDKN